MMHMNGTNGTMAPMHMMMPMSFFFGLQPTLLFSTWNLNDAGQLVGAIIVVVLFAILYEFLKTVRELLMYFDLKRIENKMKVYRVSSNAKLMDTEYHPTEKYGSTFQTIRRNLFKQYINPIHLLQSALHVVQVGMGYLLMLVAMTYNGWLFLAVCFGAGLGYLIFGRFRQSFGNASLSKREQNEHCH